MGELKSAALVRPSLKLRKENKIKTVHHSLAIEGNSLSLEQVTALLENKKVVGPKKQISEVLNALELYDKINTLNPLSENDLLQAHSVLMSKLIEKPGQYRKSGVGIFKGTDVHHVAPQAKMVPALMKDLFSYLKAKDESSFLLKACVFHYELEFIHPFEDGNGRMGLLWQQVLLIKHSILFEYISVESLVHEKQKQNQKKYYEVLEKCDKIGDSTLFIEFSLELILRALNEFKDAYRPQRVSAQQRIQLASEHFRKRDKKREFSRKDYCGLFTDISSATASRDLVAAVKYEIFKIKGEKALARYTVNLSHQKNTTDGKS